MILFIYLNVHVIMISCVFGVVEMADDENARFMLEDIIAGRDHNVTYTEEESNQVDTYLNISTDGNEALEQNLAAVEDTTEVYVINNVVPQEECLFICYYVLINESWTVSRLDRRALRRPKVEPWWWMDRKS